MNNIYRCHRYALFGMVVHLALGCTGSADTEEYADETATGAAGSSSATSDTASEEARNADVDVVTQALGSTARKHTYWSESFGGNIGEVVHWRAVGGLCSPGYEHGTGVNGPQVMFNGNGNCSFAQWLGNSADCTALIYVKTNGGWGGGECIATIYEQRRNLALSKPATQSSTRAGASAARAVDGRIDRNGDIEGNWYTGAVSHTEFEAAPWWQVDLGTPTAIDSIVLYNRTDCCSERLANLRISASQDGSNWWEIYRFRDEVPRSLTFPTRTTARFVRVELLGSNYLSLAEVQVFGP
jgi:hypothetical protein